MAVAPNSASIQIVNLVIKVNGTEMNGAYGVHSIQIHNELNRVPTARIVLFDGDPATGEFVISSSADFVPGAEVEIQAGYDSTTPNSLFKGIIVKHGLRVASQRASLLEIECKDKSVKMTVGRNNAYYTKAKDSDIIQKLIQNSGLTASATATTVQYDEVVQYYCTDWDFMLMRAEANGMIVKANDGTVTVAAPAVSGAAVLEVEYGDSIISMQVEMDSRFQLPKAESFSWDHSAQAIVQSASSNPTVNTQGNITSTTLSSVIGKSTYTLQSTGYSKADEMKSWADAQMVKSWLSRIRGKIKFQGSSLALPDTTIEITNAGDRFNGTAYISGVMHDINDGNWYTEVTIGLNPTWFVEQNDVEAPPASGIMTAVQGLQAAVVTQIDSDADGAFRVKVKLPLMQDDGEGIWARLSTFYASNKAGSFFYPEVNDEVILGFMNNDPRFPVVIGSVYSAKNAAPLTPDKKNPLKAIITKNQLKLTFDDENKVIIIETPGANKITISDKDKSIVMADQNSNTVTLDSSGIALNSAKAIKLTAQQDITLTSSTGKVALSASAGDVTLAGLNVSATAQVKFSGQGQAQAELIASGQTTVKGAIVMIN